MGFFKRIRPDPGFVSPVRSDPVRSRFCQRPSNMAARAGLVEYRVMFASLGAVCSVLVDLLAVAANWIEDPCK